MTGRRMLCPVDLLAFIVNMVMYAVFSAVILNFVGAASCTVIAVTTAVSLIKAVKGTEKQ